MAALMSIARGYDIALLATTKRALLRRGGWLAPKTPPFSAPARSGQALHLDALATVDIVTAGKMRPLSLIRANDNW